MPDEAGEGQKEKKGRRYEGRTPTHARERLIWLKHVRRERRKQESMEGEEKERMEKGKRRGSGRRVWGVVEREKKLH